MTFRTRFAPSPTGPLHLGHAYSALLAYNMACAQGGEFLLRIEDIDQARARPEWEDQIYEDLEWLGLWWPEPVMRQSDRMDAYRGALARLHQKDVTYPCICNRRDIEAAMSAPQEGVAQHGPDGLIYPGTCRDAGHDPSDDMALRLNSGMLASGDSVFSHRISDPDSPWERYANFHELGNGPDDENGLVEFTFGEFRNSIGDIVLSRKGMGTSYHLSVVLDDAAQGITHVVRGQDLFEATKIHVVLQRLLDLPTPIYHHHALIRDEAGKRLAKRDDARAISKFRDEGCSPEDIRKMVGL